VGGSQAARSRAAAPRQDPDRCAIPRDKVAIVNPNDKIAELVTNQALRQCRA
jgi:hypothetical protein